MKEADERISPIEAVISHDGGSRAEVQRGVIPLQNEDLALIRIIKTNTHRSRSLNLSLRVGVFFLRLFSMESPSISAYSPKAWGVIRRASALVTALPS